jgi:HEAT repeat protein
VLVVLGASIGYLGGLYYLSKVPKQYTSTATLRIHPAESGLIDAMPDPMPDAMPGTQSPAAARDFDRLTASARAELDGLILGFRAATEDARRLAILDQIDAGPYGEAFLGLAGEVLAAPGASHEVRARVLAMLSGNTSPEILAVLEPLRHGGSDDERELAVRAVGQVRDRRVVDFLGGFLEDPGKEVRFAALEVAVARPRESRDALLLRAMQGKHPDVGLAGLAELELEATPAAVDVLVRALDSPNREVAAEALRSLGFLLDEDFGSAEGAAAWWAAKRRDYDRNLERGK